MVRTADRVHIDIQAPYVCTVLYSWQGTQAPWYIQLADYTDTMEPFIWVVDYTLHVQKAEESSVHIFYSKCTVNKEEYC